MDVLSQAITAMRTGQPTSYRAECHAPWGRRFPSTKGAGFHVVLQGSCWLLGPDAPVALSVGDVVFFASGRGHGLADSPDTPLVDGDHVVGWGPQPHVVGDAGATPTTVVLCGSYQLDQARPHPLFRELPEVIHLPNRLGSHPSLRAAIDLLAAELERPQHGSDAIVPALLDTLLLYILRAWLEEQPCDGAHGGWAAALQDDAIAAVLCAIHETPERPWTVASLGTVAGLSRAAFARRFTALVGQAPLAYLTWWRMTTAARLLRQSDLSLGAVASQVGYTSEFAFAAAFKREYGTPPGRYRHAELTDLAS